MSVLVIGVDPGLTTGVFAVEFDEDGVQRPGSRIAVQIHGSAGVVPMVQALLARRPELDRLLAVEAFVNSTRAARSRTPAGGREARALITELGDLGEAFSIHVFSRNASMVKTWATDTRLEAADLLDCTKGMGHARDAARHALYAAVRCGHTHDPLSRKAGAR